MSVNLAREAPPISKPARGLARRSLLRGRRSRCGFIPPATGSIIERTASQRAVVIAVIEQAKPVEVDRKSGHERPGYDVSGGGGMRPRDVSAAGSPTKTLQLQQDPEPHSPAAGTRQLGDRERQRRHWQLPIGPRTGAGAQRQDRPSSICVPSQA